MISIPVEAYRILACVGSRELSTIQLDLCSAIGSSIVRAGGMISTGNAPGADQAFARGGNSADPSKVVLWLPWRSFEAQAVHPGNQVFSLDELSNTDLQQIRAIASRYHPRWSQLSRGAQSLHSRNVTIVYPFRYPVTGVIAWPSQKPGGGGTGQAVRIAAEKQIPLLDISRGEFSPEQVLRHFNFI